MPRELIRSERIHLRLHAKPNRNFPFTTHMYTITHDVKIPILPGSRVPTGANQNPSRMLESINILSVRANGRTRGRCTRERMVRPFRRNQSLITCKVICQSHRDPSLRSSCSHNSRYVAANRCRTVRNYCSFGFYLRRSLISAMN